MTALPNARSLEAKYGILNPLDRLPQSGEAIETWLRAEWQSPQSKWSREYASEPLHTNEEPPLRSCTIPPSEIDQATLDPLMRSLGYLFEICGRDNFSSWSKTRFSAGPFFSFARGEQGTQELLCTNFLNLDFGPAYSLGTACYAWVANYADEKRNPKSVAKVDFLLERPGLEQLSSDLFIDIVVPAALTNDQRHLRESLRRLQETGQQEGAILLQRALTAIAQISEVRDLARDTLPLDVAFLKSQLRPGIGGEGTPLSFGSKLPL